MVTLAATAWWGIGRIRGRGLRTALTDPLLRWAVVSAGAIGISAPADEAWHTAFGRDAVLWSPPHLLAIVATFALAVTLLRAGVHAGHHLAPTPTGALSLRMRARS
ncbi:hypothetical protein [Streptomyces sp. 2A115]|uniref:hypothetical protein n=1 Tax=Streptomyces sp. 2A115 TaxID=3457439 RepID=UPI003FD51F4C